MFTMMNKKNIKNLQQIKQKILKCFGTQKMK